MSGGRRAGLCVEASDEAIDEQLVIPRKGAFCPGRMVRKVVSARSFPKSRPSTGSHSRMPSRIPSLEDGASRDRRPG